MASLTATKALQKLKPSSSLYLASQDLTLFLQKKLQKKPNQLNVTKNHFEKLARKYKFSNAKHACFVINRKEIDEAEELVYKSLVEDGLAYNPKGVWSTNGKLMNLLMKSPTIASSVVKKAPKVKVS